MALLSSFGGWTGDKFDSIVREQISALAEEMEEEEAADERAEEEAAKKVPSNTTCTSATSCSALLACCFFPFFWAGKCYKQHCLCNHRMCSLHRFGD